MLCERNQILGNKQIFLKSKFKKRPKIKNSTVWGEEGYQREAGRRGREGSVG